MFLRATTRNKDGKPHRYWSIVENRRLCDGRVLQRHVLYLGEINDSQARAWRRSSEVLDEAEEGPRAVALRLSQLKLCKARVWGSCWSPTGCFRRAASGDCTGNGPNAAPSRIYSGPTNVWATSTNSMPVTTESSSTSVRSLTIWWGGGRTCSTPSSMCCSMT